MLLLALPLAGSTACTSNKDNPDEIRQRTAAATETIRRDAKAVAEGVKEGMGREKTININKASREDLLGLPGLTEREADPTLAEGPFEKAQAWGNRPFFLEPSTKKSDLVFSGDYNLHSPPLLSEPTP